MLLNISDFYPSSSYRASKKFLLHSDNEYLPLCFRRFVPLTSKKEEKIFTTPALNRRGRLVIESIKFYLVKNSNLEYDHFLSKRRVIIYNHFIFDETENKPLLAVMAPREVVLNTDNKKITSDQCLLYISKHISDYSPSVRKKLLEIYENFMGDLIVTNNPNQYILGHPLLKVKSKKQITDLIKNIIDGL